MPVYWGDLHGHSDISDGRKSPEEYFNFARNESKLDFCALTDHVDRVPQTRHGLMSDELWSEIKQATANANEADKFVTLLGLERMIPSWDSLMPGNLAVYYRTDDGPNLVPKNTARDWLRPGAINYEAEMQLLAQAIQQHKALTAVNHCCSWRQGYTWTKSPAQYTFDLIEVYSKWGSCEAPGAALPVSDCIGRGQRIGGTVQDALSAGQRPGIVAGSNTHFSTPGANLWENDFGNAAKYEKTGLTAVYTDSLTRENIFDALKARRCYATTGERISLLFEINGQPMGSVIQAEPKLRVHVKAEGTNIIKRIEILRNNEVIHHKIGGREDLDIYLDETPTSVPSWYYVRLTQVGEDCAWSSPIWVG